MTSTAFINMMPPEILMDIFRLLLPVDLPTLQQVCRTWRDVLYNMSDLWTFIPIEPHPTISPLDVLKMASRQATRAGILPLDFFWKLDLKESEMTDDIKAAIIELFENAPTSRWRHLSLSDSLGFLDEILDADIQFSSLHTLNLQIEVIEGFNFKVLEQIDQTAVSLEALRVVNPWSKFATRMTNILRRVTTVEAIDHNDDLELPENILRLSTAIFPAYLGGMQNVTDLTIERMELSRVIDTELQGVVSMDVGNAHYERDVHRTLNFPNLLNLKLPYNAPFILADIRAPNLQHLQLQIPWHRLLDEEDGLLEEQEIMDFYIVMLNTGGFPSSIETLILGHHLEAEVILDLITNLPKLRHFDMISQGLGESATMIRPLIPIPLDGTLPASPEELDWSVCPDLKSLTIRYQGSEETKAQLEDLCLGLLQFRSFIGFKFLRIVWADGTIKRMMISESNEQQ